MIALSLKHVGFGITDEAYMQEAYNAVQRNKWYIFKICRGDSTKINDVSSRVLIHVITHRDYTTENVALDAYVNVLAKHYLANICAEQQQQAEYDDSYQNSLMLSTNLLPTVAGCNSEGKFAIEAALTHYYFKYPEDVTRYCYTTLQKLGIKMYVNSPVNVDDVPQDKKSWNALLKEIQRYDAVTLLNATLTIANRIAAQEHRVQRRTSVININAKPVDYDVFDSIVANAHVVTRVGKQERQYALDKYTLTMCDNAKHTIDLDTTKWQPLQQTVGTVYSCDITQFIEYLYRQVCVAEGVDTKFIRWLGKHNIKTLPSGIQLEDVTIEQYILEAKLELLCALVSTKISNVVGMSEDNIYYSPRKRVTYADLRYILFNGVAVILPVQATNIGLE